MASFRELRTVCCLVLLSCGLPSWAGVFNWDCCCGGTFELTGEVLYQRPSRCDLEYAVLDPRSYVAPNTTPPQINTEEEGPVGAIKAVRPEYEAGFRLALGWIGCDTCYDVRAIYSRLHTTDSRTIYPTPESGGIWATGLIAADVTRPNNSPEFYQSILFNPSGNGALEEIGAAAEATARFQYDAFELQVANRFWQECQLWARAHVGIHFAYIDHQFAVDYVGTSHPGVTAIEFESRRVFGQVHRCGTAWGIGPHLGVESIYQVLCGFGVGGRVGLGLIAGNRQVKYRQTYLAEQAGTGAQTFEDNPWNVKSEYAAFAAPELDARLGINYQYCCGTCLRLFVEVGYEWLTYIHAAPLGPSFRMDKGISADQCASFNLDGLYFSLLVAY